MKINSKLAEGHWVKYNDTAQFQIRAFPIENLMLLSEEFNQPMAVSKKMCEWCVMDWKGMEWEDGTIMECNDKNKEYLFNYYPIFYDFIRLEIENLKNVDTHIAKKTSKKS